MAPANTYTGYVIERDDNGVEYILRHSGDDPKKTLQYMLQGDLFSLVLFLESTSNIDTLIHYWHEIPRCTGARRLDYVLQSRALLMAFASNEHTPGHIIDKAVAGPNAYGDIYLGIEPNIIKRFVSHPNCTEEITAKRDEKIMRIGGFEQGEFDDLIAGVHRATVACMKDPELADRLRSVKEEKGTGSQRVMRFDPEDVAAVGADFVERNYVALFGVNYDETTGTFTGYAD